MSDQNQAIRDDITFLRTLAEDGRDAPLNAGPALFSAGLIFGTASAVAAWGGITGAITNGMTFPALFFGAAFLHGAVMWRIGKARAARPGAGSQANRATNIAWTGVGSAIFCTCVSLIAIGAITHAWQVMLAIPPLVMSAYGGAWVVAAAMSRQRWLWVVALASFATAVGLGLVAGSAVAFYGLFVAAVFGLVALPGLVLMLKARGAA